MSLIVRLGAAVLVCNALPAVALAQPAGVDASADVEQACIDHHKRTQELELDGRLLEADVSAVACAQPSCPEEVRAMCATFVTRIRASQPTVVVELKRASGAPIVGGVVTIDRGAPVRLDGAAFALDPGTHRVDYGAAGFAQRSTTLVVRQGEKNAKLLLVIDEDEPAPRFSPWAHVLGISGLVSLGAFGVLGAVTLAESADLEDECGDRCRDERPDAVDAIVVKANVADVCLGAGIGLLAAAGLVMGLSWHPDAEGTASATLGPTGASFTLHY